MKKVISLALAGMTAAALPLSAQSTERPTLMDLFSGDTLANAIAQVLAGVTRPLADVRYDHVTGDFIAGDMAVIGLSVSPDLPYSQGTDCTITAERLRIGSSALDMIDVGRLRLSFDGVVVDFDCLPPDVRPPFGLAQIEDIYIDRLQIEVEFISSSGGGTLSMVADVRDVASIQFNADVDYISYRMPMGGGPDHIFDPDTGQIVEADRPARSEPPVVYLNSATLLIEERGAWDKAQRLLPPDMQTSDALSTAVSEMLSEVFRSNNGFENRDLSAEQTTFVEQASQVVATIPDGGRSIAIEVTSEDVPIVINRKTVDDFKVLFAALSPNVLDKPRSQTAVLSTQMLQAALNRPRDLADEDRLIVGRALLTGRGAPRNIAAGRRLLEPLAASDVQAADALAAALSLSDPEAAYGHALVAATGNLPGSLGRLEALEDRLDLSRVLDLQQDISGFEPDDPGDIPATVADLRSVALAAQIGTRQPRDYRQAYFWAALAAAAGDRSGADIRDDIDVGLRLQGDYQTWAPIAEEIEAQVLEIWLDRDLPAQFR
ncbi:hypothetical protein [Pseudaestuariivita rosea]|uniref:hypothetical protein n=1 Tax=Pseudaestuariivita rosea TaxID=2763263 RepID=UPI001ABA421E|nr:hypothetical protein [Pseudaestuariivita rosea]